MVVDAFGQLQPLHVLQDVLTSPPNGLMRVRGRASERARAGGPSPTHLTDQNGVRRQVGAQQGQRLGQRQPVLVEDVLRQAGELGDVAHHVHVLIPRDDEGYAGHGGTDVRDGHRDDEGYAGHGGTDVRDGDGDDRGHEGMAGMVGTGV